MIASTYGLQVIIFIAKGELQHIGWMLIYILAMPIYAFVLPLYSFWHFDDFTWGNTRIIQ
jgi:chitin synthase